MERLFGVLSSWKDLFREMVRSFTGQRNSVVTVKSIRGKRLVPQPNCHGTFARSAFVDKSRNSLDRQPSHPLAR